MEWDPKQTRLALCCGTNKIYMWSPAGCLSVDVPMEGKWNLNIVYFLSCCRNGTDDLAENVVKDYLKIFQFS